MNNTSITSTTPLQFDSLIQKLRGFFMRRNFKETFPQPNLSILAACEDPKTVRSFKFNNNIWPLNQTNQMHLEHILMSHSDEVDGLYCLTASYREEPNPIPNRHMLSFSMFECESKGDFDNLLDTLSELMVHLGLVEHTSDIPFFTYNELCKHYGVDTLEAEHEAMIWKEYGDVVGITYFPSRTSPFFNMRYHGVDAKTGDGLYRKCDFIICGQETFGCAERSTNVEEMRNSFYTISNGEYAKLLFEQFGKERVELELETFLSLNMIERWGYGCGISRLMRAMKIKNLL